MDKCNQFEPSGILILLSLDCRNIGYLVHPSIAQKLSESPTIADIGTGTGHFLSRVAEIYPAATLRGFDISQELYPAPDTLPSNVQLGVMDVKQPPPLEEHNRYDLVHVRLLVAAMNPSDWEIAVRNLTLLLKPGGALQWAECDYTQTLYRRGKVDSSVSAARFMAKRFREALLDRFSHGWSTLPQIMESEGYLCVEDDIVRSDRIPETREALTANGMVAIFHWARIMSRRDAPGSSSMDELDRLEIQFERDIKSGCYVQYDIHIALGFKPE